MWFANIFFYSADFLFTFLMVSFAMQKLFNFIWPQLFIFYFVACTLDVKSKNSLLRPHQEALFPRSFKVSDLPLKSVTHSELMFLSGVRHGPSFILSHVNIQLSQNDLWKRLSVLHSSTRLLMNKSQYITD